MFEALRNSGSKRLMDKVILWNYSLNNTEMVKKSEKFLFQIGSFIAVGIMPVRAFVAFSPFLDRTRNR